MKIEEIKLTEIKPLASIFRLIGSKCRQRKNILPLIARYERALYVEPFGGAGGLLFGKEPEPAEVYNDANGAFATLFRVVKDIRTAPYLKMLLDLTPMSRSLWKEAREIVATFLKGESVASLKAAAGLSGYEDSIAVAYAIFYAQNTGFGGKFLSAYGGGGNGRDAHNIIHNYMAKRRDLPLFSRRLLTVMIENLDALDCIRKYDHETTLFYIDPPYACKTKNAYGLGEFDEHALVDLLKTIKGKFVLSCYDTPIYAELGAMCDRFEFQSYSSVSRNANNGGQFERREVVYTSKIEQ